MTVANYLTLLRIFLVPLFVAVLLTGAGEDQFLTFNARVLAVAIFAIAAFTDMLDGFLARVRNEVTRLGSLLDPIADKLLISAAFISLVQLELAPAWIVVIIIGREIAVSGLRQLAEAEGIRIDVSRFGKYKMVAQVLAVGLLLLSHTTVTAGLFFLYLVMVLSIISMIGYIRKWWMGLHPERRRQLSRRRTFREMKERVLTASRKLRVMRELRRARRLERRKQRQDRRSYRSPSPPRQ